MKLSSCFSTRVAQNRSELGQDSFRNSDNSAKFAEGERVSKQEWFVFLCNIFHCLSESFQTRSKGKHLNSKKWIKSNKSSDTFDRQIKVTYLSSSRHKYSSVLKLLFDFQCFANFLLCANSSAILSSLIIESFSRLDPKVSVKMKAINHCAENVSAWLINKAFMTLLLFSRCRRCFVAFWICHVWLSGCMLKSFSVSTNTSNFLKSL